MRIVVSNIPDGARMDYIIDFLHRAMGVDIEIEQVPE